VARSMLGSPSMRYVAAILLAGACAKSGSSAPEDFSGLTDTKSDNPTGWVFRGRMDPGSQMTFNYSATDKYQGILLRFEQGEGEFAADVTSPDGEPLVFLVAPNGTEVQEGVESESGQHRARIEAHDLPPGKYFLVTREANNKATTFTVKVSNDNGGPLDPAPDAGVSPPPDAGIRPPPDAGTGSGSGSGSGSGTPPQIGCANLPALQPMPNIALYQTPTAAEQQSDTEGNVISDGAGHNIVTYTSLKFGEVFTGETVTITCSDTGMCDSATLAKFPYQGVGDGYTCDPVLARDAKTGRSFLAWINVTPRGSSEILIAESDDMGQNWENVHTVATAQLDLLDKPWIAAANGRVLVSYGDFTAGWGPSSIKVVESKDGGHTFGAPQTVSVAGSGDNLAQLSLSADGMDAYISWYQDGTLMAAHAGMGALPFSAPVNVNIGGTLTFDPPGSALGADGRFWISFIDQQAQAAVVVGKLDGMGNLAFGAPVEIADAAAKGGCSQAMHPAITTDETSTAHVAFYDNRTGHGNVWVTSSADGTTWAPNSSFTPNGLKYVPERGTAEFLGDYIGIIANQGRVTTSFAQVPLDPGAMASAAHYYFATSK